MIHVIHVIQHEFYSEALSPLGTLLIKHFRLDPKMSSLNVKIHVMVRFQYILGQNCYLYFLPDITYQVCKNYKKSIFTNYFNLYYYNICIKVSKCKRSMKKKILKYFGFTLRYSLYSSSNILPQILLPPLPVPTLQDEQMKKSI